MSFALAIDEVDPLLDLLEGEFDTPHLLRYLELGNEPVAHRLWELSLLGPAREILSRPGKEFRRNVVDFSWRISGGASPPPVALSLLVEILHAGSLVIDDIEDGSSYRRGKPALHAIYGVPVALNTGNWLYFWPFALLTRLGLPPGDELELLRELSRTLMACHAGQSLDISVKVARLTQPEIARAVRVSTQLKTGNLMGLAARIGARAAGADAHTIEALARFGRELGVGLQMLDDLGGLVTQKGRHKGHEDLRLGRLTWPWAWLAQSLDRITFQKMRSLAAEVEERVEHPETLAVEMRKALGTIGSDETGKHLRAALQQLAEAVGDSNPLDDLAGEIDRMRASYV